MLQLLLLQVFCYVLSELCYMQHSVTVSAVAGTYSCFCTESTLFCCQNAPWNAFAADLELLLLLQTVVSALNLYFSAVKMLHGILMLLTLSCYFCCFSCNCFFCCFSCCCCCCFLLLLLLLVLLWNLRSCCEAATFVIVSAAFLAAAAVVVAIAFVLYHLQSSCVVSAMR